MSAVIVSLIQDNDLPRALVDNVLVANGKWAVKPVAGANSLVNPQNRQSKRKVKSLSPSCSHVAHQLNTALLGGENYPILTAVLGTAAGFASVGAGLLFTAATTGLSVGNTVRRILARTSDEIWHVEEIGRKGNQAIYVSSFFLVDPYRYPTATKGWLIHEERNEVILS